MHLLFATISAMASTDYITGLGCRMMAEGVAAAARRQASLSGVLPFSSASACHLTAGKESYTHPLFAKLEGLLISVTIVAVVSFDCTSCSIGNYCITHPNTPYVHKASDNPALH